MPLYLTIHYGLYSLIHILKVGDLRGFGADVICFTIYRLWIKFSYSYSELPRWSLHTHGPPRRPSAFTWRLQGADTAITMHCELHFTTENVKQTTFMEAKHQIEIRW